MKLTFVNVGYGEAILAECPDPAAEGGVFVLLVDGGSAETAEYADRSSGRVPLAEYLAERGLRRIDCMVNTHIHEDHTSGLLPAARRTAPGELWQTLPADFYKTMRQLDPELGSTPAQQKFLRAINDYQSLCALTERRGGAVRALTKDAEGELCPGLRYRVLGPTRERAETLTQGFRELFQAPDAAAFQRRLLALDGCINNFSLILQLEYRGNRILLPGDTNCLGYEGLTDEECRADLFKVGHHGQRDGATRELLDRIRPEAVVCCASSDRRYQSAHPDTMAMIARTGAAVYFSDCPQVPGITDDLEPHRALEFTLDERRVLSARYLAE